MWKFSPGKKTETMEFSVKLSDGVYNDVVKRCGPSVIIPPLTLTFSGSTGKITMPQTTLPESQFPLSFGYVLLKDDSSEEDVKKTGNGSDKKDTTSANSGDGNGKKKTPADDNDKKATDKHPREDTDGKKTPPSYGDENDAAAQRGQEEDGRGENNPYDSRV